MRLFPCLCVEVWPSVYPSSYVPTCLRPSVPSSLSGCTTTAGNICGYRGNYGRAKHSEQWRTDELRHPTISPRISISPPSPNDQTWRETEEGGETLRNSEGHK
ncbi:hypothetical protein CesoFtcFv8_027738 [Champsocephalus esox]|uniref:Uncharacterized protein n=1 Tax=Champsocephalus esox TaxID=159716 RepID=A0AAN8AW82_9TELE|nr:hypothetical protein CesoFtcFv8_027738 [Champsocephalus esox]